MTSNVRQKPHTSHHTSQPAYNYPPPPVHNMFSRIDHFDVKGKLVIISGASQGLGRALATQIYARGGSVVLVARRESLLRDTVAELESSAASGAGDAVKSGGDGVTTASAPEEGLLSSVTRKGQFATYIAADLTSAKEAERVVSEALRIGGRAPDFVLCCAGACIPKLFLDLTPEELQSGVEINYYTALYLAHAAMRAMATAAPQPTTPRGIVLFSSVTHFYSFIGYSQYAPLKSALRSLGDVLRQECIPYNISVSVVFAGNFQSEGYDAENLTKPEITRQIEGPSDAITADACAEIVIRKLSAGKQMITTDFIGTVLSGLMVGASPSTGWFLVQGFFAFALLIFGPVWNWMVNRDIKRYFEKKTQPTIKPAPAPAEAAEPVKA
ncbi:uncharacterized protein V1518DRAFT_421780 [Limtongia smithiae]|uniref:uncharacterized protein n=1 Tax=Limtongia smithiae TaxID=1125753 RepID=UPI0034CD0640